MATIKDVAARAGVSTATVSRVLNGNPSTAVDLRERVLQAINELGYRPNAVARSLRVTGTHTFGLVVGDLLNPFFTELARAVEDEARNHGYSVIVGNADERPVQQDHYVRTLLERQVDGLLVVPTTETSPLLQEAAARGAPLVLVDRPAVGIDAPVVRADGTKAVRALVDHLHALGHRRMAIIAGPQETGTGRERLTAFREALEAHGCGLPSEYVCIGDFQQLSGVAAAGRLLDLPEPPTVIFAADSPMGLGLLQEIRRRGLHIPDEVALAVFDDLPWFPLLDPPVTAIAQPTTEIGREAVRMLLDLLHGEASAPPELNCELIIRGSCGAGRMSRP